MFTKLLPKKRQPEAIAIKTESKYLIAKNGADILNTPGRQILIKKIKRVFSVTEDVWIAHYVYAIEKFAEIAQELPASEIHHHSEEGGLIEHTLDAVFKGVRVTQGYILPPNSEAEKISASSDRWRFGVFISILAHDLGKVVTDIEVVFRSSKANTFSKWHPWYGCLPEGSEYTFRYRDRLKISNIDKSLHEKATMSLLPYLLTKKATLWLFDDYELIGQMFNTISHSTFGGGVVSEIVRKADTSSVSNDLGANTGVNSNYSNNIPLHEKLVTSLRYLIQEGELKRNKPGAALWVHKDETWVVSKPAIEAAQSKLMNEGHKGIPKNVVRLYENLREHGLIIPTPDRNSVWTAAIKDYSNNWEMKLTFLRFKNEVLWPNAEPEQFNGSLTPLDKNGNEIIETDVIEQPSPLKAPETKDGIRTSSEKSADVKTEVVEKQIISKKAIQGETAITKEEKRSKKVITKKIKRPQHDQSIPDSLPENDFISWLVKEVSTRKLRVNEQKAMVHVLNDYIALVTPSIFISFLSRNSLKANVYEKRAGDEPVHKYLQKELEALNINKKSIKGQNIHTLFVEGPNSQSTLKVYLLNRKMFPSMNNFSPNKALRIAE